MGELEQCRQFHLRAIIWSTMCIGSCHLAHEKPPWRTVHMVVLQCSHNHVLVFCHGGQCMWRFPSKSLC